MFGNDRDVVSIRNTFLVCDSIREVARNMIYPSLLEAGLERSVDAL